MAKNKNELDFTQSDDHHRVFVRALRFYSLYLQQFIRLEVDNDLKIRLQNTQHTTELLAKIHSMSPKHLASQKYSFPDDHRDIIVQALTTRQKHLIAVGDTAADCFTPAMKDTHSLTAMLDQLGALPPRH